MLLKHALLLALVSTMAACSSTTGEPPLPTPGVVRAARLEGDSDSEFEALRASFSGANPGYDIAWYPRLASIEASETNRVLFIQVGEGQAELRGEPSATSDLSVGDIVLIGPGESLECTGQLAGLCFTIPDPIPADLPRFVRPDWDPGITDTPGGCAEEGDAYRRILLTWLSSKGPYVLHSLNAHRVRINDSFSHYHPLQGGFDEFYLVQSAGPQARLLTSEDVARIEDPSSVTREEVPGLIDERVLHAGDLVYLPRGSMHRGVGGALVQVISVPGFKPNSEIGLDHHLRAIDERLGLSEEEALPYHVAASGSAVVK